jgi:hypothetical protein
MSVEASHEPPPVVAKLGWRYHHSLRDQRRRRHLDAAAVVRLTICIALNNRFPPADEDSR